MRVRVRPRRERALALVEADEAVARRDCDLPSHLVRVRLRGGVRVSVRVRVRARRDGDLPSHLHRSRYMVQGIAAE